MFRSRAINTFGLAMTAVVFVIVLVTKFLAGAWIAILAMVIFFMLMKGIRRHYDNVGRGAARSTTTTRCCRPGCTRSCWSPSCTSRRCGRWPSPRRPGPTCSRRSTSTTDSTATDRLLEEWDERRHRRPAQGAVLAVPRDHPADRRVRHGASATPTRAASSRSTSRSTSSGRWWEQLLHNQTALRLKGRLLFTPGRDGDLGALPAALLARSPASARERASRPGPPRRRAPRPGAHRRSRGPRRGRRLSRPARRRAQPPRPLPGRASGTTSTSGRSPTAGIVVGPRTRASSSSCGTRCPASGSSSRSPRAPRATGSCAPTRSRCSRPSPDRVAAALPVRRPRRAAAAATSSTSTLAGPARAQGRGRRRAAAAARRARRATSTVEAVPGDAGRAALAHPAAVGVDLPDGRPRPAQAPLPRRRRRSTTA